ncbi:GrpB family protein [Xylanibacillus composti]|uniref:GrpB family protein n=1 Tax=Xylanibacillus composti TaxID=1572762 RepID=A0A8J4H659_9BACL|nr:GrpB family protein [Xylanibacillus composti]GIQ69549.1 hypothetical protein XYCOK13_23730 [Xylanibacillus composti]
MSDHNRYAVRIVPYSSDWSLEFDKEKKLLMEIMAPHIAVMEHIGSTSIPQQEAKPIIDIFAAVHPFLVYTVYAELLDHSGYRYVETGMIGRHLFAKELAGTRTHHLHILPLEGLYERNELLFRDYLRAHPDLVKQYGELKRMLAEQHGSDPESYTRAKTSFIQRVVDWARTERGLPLEKVWD